MNIEKQVCTLEQAKKLKELGVAQETAVWYWSRYYVQDIDDFVESVNLGIMDLNGDYAAFTAAELGMMLGSGQNHIQRSVDGRYRINFEDGASYWNEAEARASLLIYILQKEYVSVIEVNQRLQSFNS
ncbi:MAG TPA: hypothetical protein VD996_02560 [Chitinophagaceae bacterium]|nr:hypothetical protein [Chitinophagaceae bacterium]